MYHATYAHLGKFFRKSKRGPLTTEFWKGISTLGEVNKILNKPSRMFKSSRTQFRKVMQNMWPQSLWKAMQKSYVVNIWHKFSEHSSLVKNGEPESLLGYVPIGRGAEVSRSD